MSETPEEKQALDTVDELVDEAGWREERRWSFGGIFGFRRLFGWRLDPPPGSPGLRDALHEDDEKN